MKYESKLQTKNSGLIKRYIYDILRFFCNEIKIHDLVRWMKLRNLQFQSIARIPRH